MVYNTTYIALDLKIKWRKNGPFAPSSQAQSMMKDEIMKAPRIDCTTEYVQNRHEEVA